VCTNLTSCIKCVDGYTVADGGCRACVTTCSSCRADNITACTSCA